MSLRPSFPTLENRSTQAGVPLSQSVEGDAALGGNYLGALVGKDPSGDLQFLKLNDQNELVISTESSDEACLKDRDNVAGSASFVDICTITLQNSKVYKDLGWVVSCLRDAEFEVVWVDDVGGTDTETILADPIVGSGAYTHSEGNLKCGRFTSGASGVQELRIRGKNQNALDNMKASLFITEIQ